MLRHKALMQCARYAFGFSGIVDEDEVAEVTMKKATGKVIEKPFQEFAEPAKIEATEQPQTEELL